MNLDVVFGSVCGMIAGAFLVAAYVWISWKGSR